MIGRRGFIRLLGGATGWPLVARALSAPSPRFIRGIPVKPSSY
jgi:hypothetical protein